MASTKQKTGSLVEERLARSFEIRLPFHIIPHIYPQLVKFSYSRLSMVYVITGAAPYEIAIPREFIVGDRQDVNSYLPASTLDLIWRVNKAFRHNGHTQFEQYLYLQSYYEVVSLYQLEELELQRILLELVKDA